MLFIYCKILYLSESIILSRFVFDNREIPVEFYFCTRIY